MIQYDVRAQNIHPKILQLHKTMEESVERVPMPEVQCKPAMMLDVVAVTTNERYAQWHAMPLPAELPDNTASTFIAGLNK